MRPVRALIFVVLALARPVAAQPVTSEPAVPPPASSEAVRAKPPVSAGRRALAITAAIVPGIVIRGAGSWIVGEKRAAKRLAIVAGAGLVLAGAAGGLVGGTGGNPYTIPAVPLVLAGAGAILTTWAADIWTAAGGACVCGRVDAAPPWSIEIGETWLHDAYRGRLHGRVAGRIELGRVDVGAAALAHVGGESWLGFADARVRILGAAATGTEISDGSRLYARVGGRVQRDDVDRVTQAVGELELGGRYDLRHLDAALRAGFIEMSTGVGLDRVEYAKTTTEVDTILLHRFGTGMYLPGGEALLYYDHRRDGLAGGIAASRAAGFVGSVGAAADVRVHGPWAVRGELQIGNAWVSTLALSFRGGPR
jgi:hypothetical protein